jgi:[protein-PII] uridylyltransferase
VAAKTFLSEDQIKSLGVSSAAGGSLSSATKLSHQLAEILTERLSRHPNWLKARPVAIGSWSRGQLCPRSDIDILFLGPEKEVKKLVDDFHEQGLRLRYRVPANREDWAEGVETFDIVALFNSKPLNEEDAELSQMILRQKQKLYKKGRGYLIKLVKEMKVERKEREKRYDLLSNFLEPNLKYGPGALRDIDQALSIDSLLLSQSQEESVVRARKVLVEARDYFLFLRQKIQLGGGLDTLSSALQKELTDELKHTSIKDFMREVQNRLSEVSFYADFIVEKALASPALSQKVERIKIETLENAFRALMTDSGVLMQERVRRFLSTFTMPKKIDFNLIHFLGPETTDQEVVAYFKSGLMSFLLRDLRRVRGLVQHDQYHRLTVDAHTLQAVREVIRVKKSPKVIGRLKHFVKRLNGHDWAVLIWTALFHDLGKGLDGDHANKGAEIVKKEMIRLGLSLRLTVEVAWMVQKHLLLSGAAFRQNPEAVGTWQWLFSQGLQGRRIPLLAVFTAVDIRATNPDAWNDWKERLLFELSVALESPKANRLHVLLEKLEKSKLQLKKDFFEKLDPAVIEAVSTKALFDDYKMLLKLEKQKTPASLDVVVVKGKVKNRLWIRFHSAADKAGLFLDYVGFLYAAGLSVQEAYIQTYPVWGVYDWFQVQSSKAPGVVKKMLSAATVITKIGPVSSRNSVRFERVDLVRSEKLSAIFSFRGRDQKGALLEATNSLYKQGLSIQWARVHTWGQQIDDVFGVEKTSDVEWPTILAEIRKSCAETPGE